jgi:hypothetical protein
VSTIIPDLVVGQVGFGPGFASDNAAAMDDQIRTLIRRNKRLIRVLKQCVKPTAKIADEAHEAIMEGYEL